MSYLDPVRLHFAGRFQAAVSTINNDPGHYDNQTFKPEYQKLGQGTTDGWWNPRGDADWRLIGCRITGAWMDDAHPAAADDPITRGAVADSDRAAPAKLADLDPCQQMVSTIWGLQLRLCGPDGRTYLRGSYAPAPFMDIWDRAPAGSGDVGACATYQSVLTDLEWDDVSASPFLTALRAAGGRTGLSVKFMVDGYNMTFGDPEFTRGRIVGTIGPAHPGEPAHAIRGRHLIAAAGTGGNFFTPAGGINHCDAVLDRAAGKLRLDLGNALPTSSPGGPQADQGAVSVRAGGLELGAVPYLTSEWYERTAGIVALPADRRLTDTELDAVASTPLAIDRAGSPVEPAIAEVPLDVRADACVFCLDPGESVTITLTATRLGAPLADATVLLAADSSQLQGDPGIPTTNPGVPVTALAFPASVVTGPDGTATATLTATAPGNPRGYIDGQIYGVRPTLATAAPDQVQNQWAFVSLLLFDAFVPDEPPSWHGSLQPIFQQYANLYPIMKSFLDLSDYDQVVAIRALLELAFALDPKDPNSMPVTRDLSAAKRAAILRWLQAPDAEGRLLLGERRPEAEAVQAAALEAVPAELRRLGGKSVAMSRRLAVQTGKK